MECGKKNNFFCRKISIITKATMTSKETNVKSQDLGSILDALRKTMGFSVTEFYRVHRFSENTIRKIKLNRVSDSEMNAIIKWSGAGLKIYLAVESGPKVKLLHVKSYCAYRPSTRMIVFANRDMSAFTEIDHTLVRGHFFPIAPWLELDCEYLHASQAVKAMF